jgi:hypothetical protein
MLTLLMLLAAVKPDLAAVQSEIQGLYENIRQMQAQSTTSADIDDLHAVLYTPDWTFVDKSGQTHTWAVQREEDITALGRQSPEALYQPIRKLTLSSDGGTATVNITERGIKYEDTWVRAGNTWKMKRRRQL